MKEQKKSSWGAVLVSFLKEFLLNSFEAPGHLYYDENLTNEGKRKKNYIILSIGSQSKEKQNNYITRI